MSTDGDPLKLLVKMNHFMSSGEGHKLPEIIERFERLGFVIHNATRHNNHLHILYSGSIPGGHLSRYARPIIQRGYWNRRVCSKLHAINTWNYIESRKQQEELRRGNEYTPQYLYHPDMRIQEVEEVGSTCEVLEGQQDIFDASMESATVREEGAVHNPSDAELSVGNYYDVVGAINASFSSGCSS